MRISSWLNVPAVVLQLLLLLTFAFFPAEQSHRHSLSFGLVISLIFLELSFVIPLGTKPQLCHDAITPADMYTSLSCAWTGALLEMGCMGAVVWSSFWLWIAHLIGWGVPGVFLAISLPITGVSYRSGATCLPNAQNTFITWFGWLIAFGCLAALIQFATTFFCLWLYLRYLWTSTPSSNTGSGKSSAGSHRPLTLIGHESALTRRLQKQFAWRRARRVMSMQWRSIVLSVFVIFFIIYFCSAYLWQTSLASVDQLEKRAPEIKLWTTCLILHGGNKTACLPYAKPLRISETSVEANFFIAALVGWFTFALMIRASMLVSWCDLLRRPCCPRRRRQHSIDHRLEIALNRREHTLENQHSHPDSLFTKAKAPSESLGQDAREMIAAPRPVFESDLYRVHSPPTSGDKEWTGDQIEQEYLCYLPRAPHDERQEEDGHHDENLDFA